MHHPFLPIQSASSTLQEGKYRVGTAPLNLPRPSPPEGQPLRSCTQFSDLAIPADSQTSAAEQTYRSTTPASARSSVAPGQVPEARSAIAIAQGSSTSSHPATSTDALPSFGRLPLIPKVSGSLSTQHGAKVQREGSLSKLLTIPEVSDKSIIHPEPSKSQREHPKEPGSENASEHTKAPTVRKGKRATPTQHTTNELEDDHHRLSDLTASSATTLAPSTGSADIPSDSSHRQTPVLLHPEPKVKAKAQGQAQGLACPPASKALNKSHRSMGQPQDKVRKTSRAPRSSKRLNRGSSDWEPVQRSTSARRATSVSTIQTSKSELKLGSRSPLPPAPKAQPEPRALPDYTDSDFENDAPVPPSKPHTTKSRSRSVRDYTDSELDSELEVAPVRPARRLSKTPLSRPVSVRPTSRPPRPVPDYISSEPEDVPVNPAEEASKSKAPMPSSSPRPRPARQALPDYTDSESEGSRVRPTQKPSKVRASALSLPVPRPRPARQSVPDHTDSESDHSDVGLKSTRWRASKSKYVLPVTSEANRMQESEPDGSEEEEDPGDPVDEALVELLNDADDSYDEANVEVPTVVSPGHTDATLVARAAPASRAPRSSEGTGEHDQEVNRSPDPPKSNGNGVRASVKRRTILDDSGESEVEPTADAATKQGRGPSSCESYSSQPDLLAPPSLVQSTSSLEEELESVDLYKLGIIEDEEDLYFARLALLNPPPSDEEPATTGPELPQGVDYKGDAWPEQESGCCRAEGISLIPPAEKAQHVPVQHGDLSDTGTGTTPVLSSARGSRADGRRLVANLELQKRDLDIDPDLLSVSQLRTREKALRFAKSAIHDWGLFALEPIARGEMVIEYVGEVVRHQLADEREMAYEISGQYSTYLFRVDDDLVVDATRKGNFARLVNHCCTPNCGARIFTVNGRKHIVLFAREWIQPGDEVTYDYKLAQPKDEVDASPCLCGSEGCRGYL